MKSFFKYCVFFVYTFFLFCTFSSCHKPEYNPEKKISKIFGDFTTITNGEVTYSFPKTLQEEWIWEKNKLLKIKTMGFEYHFTYDKNNYLKEVSSDFAKIVFDYKDKMFNKMTVIHENGESMSLEVTKVAGKKITQLRESYFDWKSNTTTNELAQMLTSVTRYFFTEVINDGIKKSISSQLNHSNRTKSIVSTILWDLSYRNDNVAKIKKTFDADYSITYNYQYDDKVNPFYYYYLQSASEGALFGLLPFSKNNIISADEEGNISNFEYEYDGDFPILQKKVATQTYYDYEYIQNPITGEWIIIYTIEVEQKNITKFYFEYCK